MAATRLAGCAPKSGKSILNVCHRLDRVGCGDGRIEVVKGDTALLQLHRAFAFGIAVAAALLLVSTGFPIHTRAQTNPITLAPGFEANIFADPTNVNEFSLDAFTGPSVIAFDSRGRLFVGTYPGKILILQDNDGDGRADEVKTFANGIVVPLGMEFRANGDLFVTNNPLRGAGRVLRLRDTNGDDVADEVTTIVDNLPSQGDHQTDKIKFGPDGLLYIGQGSSTDDGTPSPDEPPEGPLNATILRVDVDSSNPQVQVVATGLRNPFGMAFDPVSHQLFSVDVGAGELGDPTSPPEEVNWIVMGGNYGFPNCVGIPDPSNPACAGVRAPMTTFAAHATPTSITFYKGPQSRESENQMLVTIFKRLVGIGGGDLERFVLSGSVANGFQTTLVQPSIIDFGLIDPNDGPVDTAIDPISGDIYVARFDPVHHANSNEHHHFIYRIHRTGSDALPFIGPPTPSAIKAGSPGATISLITRHVKTGAIVFDLSHNVALSTRQGSSIYELLADLPASAIAAEGSITLEVRNPDSSRSNQQTFTVTKGDPGPPPDKSPQLTSMFVYKKKRANVIDQLSVGMNPKKFRLVVDGTDFDSGAQLLVNSVALDLETSSATELVGQVTRDMVAAPGTLTVQIRNSTGKTSNTLTLTVVP